jgi:hypothetical protein
MRPEPVRLSLDASTLICAVATAAVLFLAIIGVGTAIGGEAAAGPTRPSATAPPPSPPCAATLTLVALKGKAASYLLVVDQDGRWTVTWPRQADDEWKADGKPDVKVDGDRVRIAGTGKQRVGFTVVAVEHGLKRIPETECATT